MSPITFDTRQKTIAAPCQTAVLGSGYRNRKDIFRPPLASRPVAALVVGLALVTCGCSMLPKGSGAASASRPGDFDDDDEAGGRILRTGQTSGSTSQVRQASVDGAIPGGAPDRHVVAAVAEEEEGDGFQLEDLDPVNIFNSGRDALGYGPDEGVARNYHEEGLEYYRAEQYKAAGDKFTAAAKRWPDTTLEEDALFFAGESYFFADEYPDALRSYEKLLKKHDYTHHLDMVTRRLFAIGRYWEQVAKTDSSYDMMPFNATDETRPWVDTVGHALKAYEHIRMYDPTGPLADDAVMATAHAHVARGDYTQAARNFDLLRTEYTKSEHQLKAHLAAIECWQRIYQGGYYDIGPLDKAAEVADQALIQFGPELGESRPQVVEAKNKIVEEKAARDLLIGKYYDKRKRYGSARFYYNSLLEEYPHTSAAQAARERLANIQDLPDKPKNHVKWFTDMFEREQY